MEPKDKNLQNTKHYLEAVTLTDVWIYLTLKEDKSNNPMLFLILTACAKVGFLTLYLKYLNALIETCQVFN